MTTPPPQMPVWNAAVRVTIELAALAGLAMGGWELGGDTAWRWILLAAVPVLAAAAWGRYRVPGDPGPAPVPVPGGVRLAIEAVVLAGGATGYALAAPGIVWIGFTIVVISHYLVSLDRIRWLLDR